MANMAVPLLAHRAPCVQAETAFVQCASHLDAFPELSQNEVEFERFLQNFMRRIRTLAVGEVMLVPAGWANVGVTAPPVLEQQAAREKDPKLAERTPKPEV